MAERTFSCFGTTCAIRLDRLAPEEETASLLADGERTMLNWHARFTRFAPESELSRLNADSRQTVPVSATMARFAAAAREVAELTGGLVDPTLVGEIEGLGYTADLDAPLPLRVALEEAPPRRPGAARPEERWRELSVDLERARVTRPPGLEVDSGGIAKGLVADLLGAGLAGRAAWVVDCGGDLRIGGTAGLGRPVDVRSPFDPARILHRLVLAEGGVATSSIGDRSWRDADGRPAHHLLDPSTGRPAFTGVVQVTALAPSALEAEARAKAALLAGPAGAHRWLPHGGVVVLDDGSHRVCPALSERPGPPAGR